MATEGVQPLGSMGTDTPLAVLSERPTLLYNYFKQLFAQVTNPPIDPIREELITSTQTMLGPEGNLLKPTPANCRMIKLDHPILTDSQLAQLRQIDLPGFKSVTLSMLFPVADGPKGLGQALDRLFHEADRAVEKGANLLILSDRGVDRKHAAIPALLAGAGLQHHLIQQGSRTRVGLVLESAEPREVHHFALLIGYGVAAINPYLAFETVEEMVRKGLLPGIDEKTAIKNYIKGAIKGVVKTMSKMGISTIQSYRGAQIFEAVGLHSSVINKYFTRTPSRVQGADLSALARELLTRHAQAFPDHQTSGSTLEAGGEYSWRREGEAHLLSPQSIHKLQQAVRLDDFGMFKEYSKLIDDQDKQAFTLRGLLEFKKSQPVLLSEVETVESIMKRFKTGAMSYGSISKEAHEALAIAMNRIGGKSNTGEGGEDPERYTWKNDLGDSKNSAIKQVASGRFGVTSLYLSEARELQIKMAQGAQSCGAGADNGNFFAGADLGQFGRKPSFLPAFVDNRALDAFDGHRGLDAAKRAGTFTRRGANASGELGKVIGSIKPFQRLAPKAVIDEIVPFGNQVIDGTTGGHAIDKKSGLAERNATVHATRTLNFELILAQVKMKFIPIAETFQRRTISRNFPHVFDESCWFAHDFLFGYKAFFKVSADGREVSLLPHGPHRWNLPRMRRSARRLR